MEYARPAIGAGNDPAGDGVAGASEPWDADGPMRHRTLTQRIYNHIRRRIETGVLLPGTRLDEKLLSEEMAVSRTPLREAIGLLAQDGLVDRKPYRANFVKTFSASQISDLYEVRKVLECLAVRLAVKRMSSDDIGTCRRILADVGAALKDGNLEAYSEADDRFHLFFILRSGNEVLIDTLGRLRSQIRVVRSAANRDPNVVERTAHERPLILAAIEARDADRAARLMEEHIDGVKQSMATGLECRSDSLAEVLNEKRRPTT